MTGEWNLWFRRDMALTFTDPTITETVHGMEICVACAVHVAASRVGDRFGNWQIDAASPRYETTHCDLCHSPLTSDRVSAAVEIFA